MSSCCLSVGMKTQMKPKKSWQQALRERPVLRKYNEGVYIMMDSDSERGYKIVQSSNGMSITPRAWYMGWQHTKGFYYGNSYMNYVSKEASKFKLIGGKR